MAALKGKAGWVRMLNDLYCWQTGMERPYASLGPKRLWRGHAGQGSSHQYMASRHRPLQLVSTFYYIYSVIVVKWAKICVLSVKYFCFVEPCDVKTNGYLEPVTYLTCRAANFLTELWLGCHVRWKISLAVQVTSSHCVVPAFSSGLVEKKTDVNTNTHPASTNSK